MRFLLGWQLRLRTVLNPGCRITGTKHGLKLMDQRVFAAQEERGLEPRASAKLGTVGRNARFLKSLSSTPLHLASVKTVPTKTKTTAPTDTLWSQNVPARRITIQVFVPTLRAVHQLLIRPRLRRRSLLLNQPNYP